MNKFANMSGTKVKMNLAKSNILNDRVYDGIVGTVDFQCNEILNVPGLVYVNFLPKGKRKIRSLAVHQDNLELCK